MTIATRHKQHWTEQEIGQAFYLLGRKPVSEIAQQLGRSERSLRRILGNTQQQVMRTEGMSMRDVSEELGVHVDTVRDWIGRGLLRARRLRVETRKVYSISFDAMTDLLRDCGYALTSTIRPVSPIWQDIVQEIRADLEQQHIAGAQVESVLLISRKSFATYRRLYAFPEPSFRFGAHSGGDWYLRQDIVAWLHDHPRYWTAAAREELLG